MPVDPAFEDAGQVPGLIIWRIEKLQVVRQSSSTYGEFYIGDSYILLCTKRHEKSDKLLWDIHFWLGSQTSQDEQGVAAYKTVELDDHLGGAPVQHREVQDHESQLFLSYFKKGISYLEGGVDSGFRKVEKGEFQKRLLQVKGKRNVRVRQVKCDCSSLNKGDVFILDCGETIHLWNGPLSNPTERIKGAEVAKRIRDEERLGKAVISIVDDSRWDTDSKFYRALGSREPIKSSTEGGDDLEYERTVQDEIKLYRVSDADGQLEMSEVGSRPLDQEKLDSNDCFILDSGPSGIYAWIGRRCTQNERKSAWDNALEFIHIRGYPEWTKVTRLAEGGETPIFKQFFSSWSDPNAQIGLGRVYTAGTIAHVDQTKFDATSLHRRRKQIPESRLPDDGRGTIKMWRVEGSDARELPTAEHGTFYSGCAYVTLYTYHVGPKELYILYYWQGSECPPDQKAASAMITQMMDEVDLGGKAVQVRVNQGREPEHFLRIFQGKMVVFLCKGNSCVDEANPVMFHIRGTTNVNTRAIQVLPRATSLNSNDVFVIKKSQHCFLWIGKGSWITEREMATTVVKLITDESPVIVDEGKEPGILWEIIGGKAEYSQGKIFEKSTNDISPRLFQCSNASGKFTVEEIVDFSQDDLYEDDVMLLDIFDEVFVWIGKGANAVERKESLEMAMEYIRTDPLGRTAESTLILQVRAGYEPPNFTGCFHGWNPDKWNKGKTYEDIKSELRRENAGVTFVRDELSKYGRKYPVNQLVKKRPPIGVDVTCKEKYLADSDFTELMGMTKEEFYALPKWRQGDHKKRVGLF